MTNILEARSLDAWENTPRTHTDVRYIQILTEIALNLCYDFYTSRGINEKDIVLQAGTKFRLD